MSNIRDKKKRPRRPSRRSHRPPSPPQSIGDVMQILADLLFRVRAGKIDPKRAVAAAQVAMALMKAIQLGDLDQRLKALEALRDVPAFPGPTIPTLVKENSDDLV